MSRLQRLTVAGVVLVAVLATTATSGAEQPTSDANRVNVTIKYTGKGDVDTTHRLWVWLFDSPEIGAGSIPIAEASLDKNGATANFTAVSAAKVYIAVAYDEAGGFGGQAPPPPGSPIALYGAKTGGEPQAVTPGSTASVTITFDDSQRMQ